jgi:hypothetical protein
MSLCMCVYVCTYASLTPERLGGCSSFSVFKSLSDIGRRSVNMNFLAPKMWAFSDPTPSSSRRNKMTVFSRRAPSILVKFDTF